MLARKIIFIFQKHKRLRFKDSRLVVEHITEHYTIEELAERFEISPTAMKKCFKEMYGVPIYTYCRTYRLQIAEKLLREGQLSVAEIAAKLGISIQINLHQPFALNTK